MGRFSDELLEGWDSLYTRTDGVLKAEMEMADFFKELAAVEKKYADELKKCIGKAKVLKNKTVRTAWEASLNGLSSIADQHNAFGTNVGNEVGTHIASYVKDKDTHRKKKLQRDYKDQLATLQRTKKNYAKLSEEADKAQALLIRGQSDSSMKPAKLSTLSTKSSQASDRANAADIEYQDILKDTNDKQDRYFETDMPNLLDEFQYFEEDRVSFTQEAMQRFVRFLKEMAPCYETQTNMIAENVESVDKDKDIEQFVQRNKTGVSPPPAIEYEPYDMENPTSNRAAPPKTAHHAAPPGAGFGKKAAPGRKDWGLSPADENLNDADKKAKLEAQLVELDQLIASENQAKAGIEKLIQFYQADPNAQKQAEGELAEMQKKIAALVSGKEKVLSQMPGSSTSGKDFEFHANKGQEPEVLTRAKGLYDYAATCETELSFKEGDILNISEKDDSGWWFAELNGKTGFVPQNYVEEIPK